MRFVQSGVMGARQKKMGIVSYLSQKKVGYQMPHSLRARLSWLRYKKIISDKDYKRLCKALDNENILDKIKTEIIELRSKQNVGVLECLDIIDKYKAESEE